MKRVVIISRLQQRLKQTDTVRIFANARSLHKKVWRGSANTESDTALASENARFRPGRREVGR